MPFEFDLKILIQTVGYLGVFAMVFAESGILIGLFLPGDSLLFTAGFLASQGFFDVATLCMGCFIAAVAGDSVGYAFGYRVGRGLFQREDSLIFHKRHLLRAEEFYQRHGGKAIILARFVPIVRTFAPIVAGIGQMEYSRFLMFNVVGAAAWAIGVTLAGYFLGSLIPDVDRYLLPIIIGIIFVSLLPTVVHGVREYRQDIIDYVRHWRGRPEVE